MCQKVSYQTRAEAMRDAKVIRANQKRYSRNCISKGRKFRPYLCGHCGLWHLTTQKPKIKTRYAK